ncbi:MAG: ABC transporter permease subunit [Cyanothece sp. SIO1E1]|nr:ABC transporter permease subunit [Cyanothece sp. SIO1E1]
MRTIFGNIIAIYRKELQSYFASSLAYVIAGVFWLLGGFFLVTILLGPDGLIAQVAAIDQLGVAGQPVDLPYEFLKIYLNILSSLSLFILPILSMGLYAEERKQGTLELLATSPITNWAVALGKLMGVVTFYTTMLLPLVVCEAIALSASDPPIEADIMLIGHIGLVALAASVLSLGMFVSSLTDSTVLAAILTFALVLLLWVIDLIGNAVSGAIGEAFKHLSLIDHYNNLVQGIFDTSSLLLFATYIVLGLFLTVQVIEALRFQRA